VGQGVVAGPMQHMSVVHVPTQASVPGYGFIVQSVGHEYPAHVSGVDVGQGVVGGAVQHMFVVHDFTHTTVLGLGFIIIGIGQ